MDKIEFENEIGNKIKISIEKYMEMVLLKIEGPNSDTTLQLTSYEADRLGYLLWMNYGEISWT